MAETATDWMTEARARADATVASPFPGPGWQALHGQSWAGEHVVADESGHPLLIGGDGELARADVDFAAHARQDLPRALDALERVRALCQASMFGTAQAAVWPRDVLAAIAGEQD